MKKIDPTKLSQLTKEEKLKLYDTIQAKKLAAKRSRAKFVPHEGQLQVLKSKKYIRLVTAGNGYGKSALGVNAALAAAMGYNPWTKEYTKSPSVGVVVLDSPMKVKEVFLKELDKWCDISEIQQIKNGKPYVNELVFSNGSRIILMFHEQEEAVFESIELDYAIMDEPPPKFIFTALARGQRTKGSKPWILIIGTPLAAAWLRQDLFEPWERKERDDIDCFRGSTIQNVANLSEGYVEQFSRLLSEEEKKIRLEGQWFDLGGLALKHLIKPELHYISPFPWPQDDPVIIAVDCHPSKAHVAVALGKNKYGRRIVVGELAAKATARDFALKLHEWSRNWKVVDIVVDSLGSADTTGGEGFKSFIQVLKDCGIRCRPTTFEEKSDSAWIDRVRTALEIPLTPDNFGQTTPGLQIFRSCPNIIKDIENVAWLRHKNLDMNKDKLDISHKDYLACLKYALAAESTHMNPKLREAKTVRLADKKAISIRSRYFGKR
jgi:hypothetical protein